MILHERIAAGLGRLASAIVSLKAQVDSLSGGGGVPPTQATLNVSPAAKTGYAEVVVVDAAVAATALIRVSLVAELDAENDLEELADSDMRVFGVAEAGQVRFVLTGTGSFVGDFKVLYEVINP